jgi:hypothetical protein
VVHFGLRISDFFRISDFELRICITVDFGLNSGEYKASFFVMRSSVKLVAGIVGLAAVVIAAGALIAWWGGRGGVPPVAVLPPSAVDSAPDSSVPTNFTSLPRHPHAAAAAPTTTNAAETEIADASSPTNGPAAASWDDKLDQILGADNDDKVKVQQLLAAFPSMPPEVQGVTAQHLVNLLSDDDYAPLGKMLADPKSAPQVLDVLIGDVLNRPNPVKLPLLLQVASAPDHPKAGEAKDLLELYLGADYGSDWQMWQSKMQQWLQDNPG